VIRAFMAQIHLSLRF